MTHNDLALLKPAFEDRVRAALDEMRNDPVLKELGVTSIGISETKRDIEVQMAYFSRGRMKPTDVKTMYKAAGLYQIRDDDASVVVTWTLDSKHLRGEAVDLVPQKNGIQWWTAPETVWKRMGEIGVKAGLSWGGSWKNTDNPHFEI